MQYAKNSVFLEELGKCLGVFDGVQQGPSRCRGNVGSSVAHKCYVL